MSYNRNYDGSGVPWKWFLLHRMRPRKPNFLLKYQISCIYLYPRTRYVHETKC